MPGSGDYTRFALNDAESNVNDEKNVPVIEIEKAENLCSVGGVVCIRTGTRLRLRSVEEILILSPGTGAVAWDESQFIPKNGRRAVYSVIPEKIEKSVTPNHNRGKG